MILISDIYTEYNDLYLNKIGLKLSDKKETRSVKFFLFQLQGEKSHLFRIFITSEFMAIRTMIRLKFLVILSPKKILLFNTVYFPLYHFIPYYENTLSMHQ